jgi:hypothetical protein
VIRTLEVSLGDVEGQGFVSEQTTIARAVDGRFFVSSRFETGIIKIFGPDGKYLGSAGRPGEGPGEFRSPSVIIPDESGITIFDDEMIRATRLDLDLEHIETRSLPFVPDRGILASPGLFFLHTMSGAASEIHSIQIYDWNTGTVTPVAALSTAPKNPSPTAMFRHLAVDSDSTVWAASWDQYRIERWRIRDGSRVSAIERTVDWFPPDVPHRGAANVVPPNTRLRDIAEDVHGRLWVLLQTQSSNWRPLTPVRHFTGELYTSHEQMNQLYDSVIEVLDSETGSLIASGRFPGRNLGFLGPGRVFQYAEDEAGHPRYEVYRLAVSAQKRTE